MVTVQSRLPDDPHLLAAAGAVALAHGHLEHVLRMTVKSLCGISTHDALDATAYQGGNELRRRIRRLARNRRFNELVMTKLDAVLNHAATASRKRNELIHRPWAVDEDGNVVVKDEEHSWGSPPTIRDLENLQHQISLVVEELNHARLKGFLKEAISAAAEV